LSQFEFDFISSSFYCRFFKRNVQVQVQTLEFLIDEVARARVVVYYKRKENIAERNVESAGKDAERGT